MIDVALAALRSAAGLGVAGIFAGHPEQAGEAADFANVVPVAAGPKGMFPWFVPGRAGRLSVFPVTHDELVLPDQPGVDLQIEPQGVCSRDLGTLTPPSRRVGMSTSERTGRGNSP